MKLPKQTRNIKNNTGKSKSNTITDIAIIGIACRFPGANNYFQFWDNLVHGRNHVKEITPDRWDIDRYYSSDPTAENKSISKWGGLLDQINHFDPAFFNISPREAEIMDPQQRLLLEETWHCIEDSGVNLEELQHHKTAVYVGVMAIDYQHHLFDSGHVTDSYECLGNYGGMLANRISYCFNLTGESKSIDAACASSLVSLHDARRSLMSGENDYAIVASASVICHPWRYLSFSKSHMLSPEGQCKTFDIEANGYVPGEGVGALLLCPLEKAIEKKYPIYGILKGTAVKHTGKSVSITAPKVEVERKTIEEAFASTTEVSSESITYVEAHGTGTSLGDPIEVEALTQAFNTEKKQYCAIGSVKTNIGHLEATSGMAGIIKVLLMMKYKKIPPTLNIKTVNPIIEFERSPFRLALSVTDWSLPEALKKRRAGINSFGFGGVNAHSIVEEYTPPPANTEPSNLKSPIPFVLSAKTVESLSGLINEWKNYINSTEFNQQHIENICTTLLNGREQFNYRLGHLVSTKQQLVQFIQNADSTKKLDRTGRDFNNKKLLLYIGNEPELDHSNFEFLCAQHPILQKLASEKNALNNEDDKECRLNQFIALLTLSEAILSNKIAPACFIGDKLGNLVIVVLSGMLDLETMMQWLKGEEQKITLHRPKTTVYDPVNKQLIKPYLASKKYLEYLINSIAIDSTLTNHLITKAAQLNQYQFTFKNYLAQWSIVLKNHGIITSDALAHPEQLTPKASTLFVVCLIDCLRKLQKKWELSNHDMMIPPHIIELCDLLSDKVINEEQLAQLITHATEDTFTLIASNIQKTECHFNVNKSYSFLKKFNTSVPEIDDVSLWLDAMAQKSEMPIISELTIPTENRLILQVGLKNPLPKAIRLQITKIDEFLMTLWLHGVPMIWSDWYKNENYQKVALPGYVFAKDLLWNIKDNSLPLSKGTSKKDNYEHNIDIAIIGMNGVFPGSPNLEAYWENLITGNDLISEIPESRWDWRRYYGDVKEDHTKIKWGGFVKGIDSFDARFFNISVREAELMDPQQRVFLEVVWNAIEHAGYATQELASIVTGVFVGVSTADFAELLSKNNHLSAYSPTGTFYSVLANRVSYLLNFVGPSVPIDTACSSSLVAIHEAVKAIQSGDCEVAIAGGVNALLTPTLFIDFNKAGMLSADGRCKTFDKSANGYVRGEGAGAIVLKPLNKALEDHDTVYAIIKGSAINHGGHVNSLTVPNPNAQAAAVIKACERANVPINSISYIEAHGTGTPLGDPIEINGLKKAFSVLKEQQNSPETPIPYCGIGSVKTNIGHLEAASGIAGLLKVVLAMNHKQLPAIVHFNEQNPYIDIKNTPFYFVNKTQKWNVLSDLKNKPLPRRAGVSSFGFGGANAHVILEEAPETLPERGNSKPYYLIALSAKTSESLIQKSIDLKNWLKTSQHPLAHISFTLNVGRNHFKQRIAFVVSSLDDLQETLTQFLKHPQLSPSEAEDRLQMQKQSDYLVQTLSSTQGSPVDYQEKLFLLSQCYKAGCDIDWKLLHQSDNKKRISLPTYPFIKESYTLPHANKTPPTTQALSIEHSETIDIKPSTSSHPLLDEKLQTKDLIRFTKRLSSDAFYLDHHRVDGIPVFPAAAYLEMARAAANNLNPTASIVLRNITWLKPLRVTHQNELVSLDLTENSSGYSFKIYTINPESQPSVYAQGKINYQENPSPTTLAINDIKQLCTRQHKKRDIYNNFNEIGLNYGTNFQIIEEYLYYRNQAIVYLQLPEPLETTAHQFGMHPSLLDGALQACIGLLPNNNTLYLPFSMGKVEIIAPLTSRIYIDVHQISNPEKVESPIFSLQIANEQGVVLVRIKEFSLRALQINTPPPPGDINYYTSIWKKQYLNETGLIPNSILIFSDDEEMVAALRQQLPQQTLILVKSGDTYLNFAENSYTINYCNQKDYATLLHHLHESDRIPNTIIYANNINEENDFSQLTQQIEKSFYPVFYLSKAIIHQKINKDLQLLYVKKQNESQSLLFTSAFTGFSKTIHLENPKLKVRVLIIQNIKQLIDELKSTDSEVRYTANDDRYIKSFQHFEPLSVTSSLFKKKGIYLITGGVGGLGLVFSRYLAKHYQAQLILIGRSKLNEKQAALLRELEQFGAQIHYMRACVTQSDDIKSVLKKIKKQFGLINGIIHSAGVIRDSFLSKKTYEETCDVFAPKITGTINLDKVTQAEPLDFFIMFSSIVSILGNIGQADYAYANGFINSFAEYRNQLTQKQQRSGKTIAISWPLWADGGMQVDPSSIKLMEKKLGLVPLSTQDGLTAFEYSLYQKHSQQIVVSGHKDIIEKNLGDVTAVEDVKPEKVFNANPSLKEARSLTMNESIHTSQHTVQDDMITMTSNILKIKNINLQEQLSEYGMDSIGLTELTMQINDRYGVELTPAVLFEHTSLASIVDYLLSNYHDNINRSHGSYESIHKVSTKSPLVQQEPEIASPMPVELPKAEPLQHEFQHQEPITPIDKPIEHVSKEPISSPSQSSDFDFTSYSDIAQLPGYLALKQRQVALGYGSGSENIFFDENEGVADNTSIVNGKKVINFSSYNYLGLSGNPSVSKAAIAAIKKYGTSVSASRVVAGEKRVHKELEKEIAEFIGTEDCLVFSSGHATNVGVISHLMTRNDLILHDELAHNSLIQGCLFSDATRLSFRHNDWGMLVNLLQKHRQEYERVLIVIEGVYSMDGDIPDVPALLKIKEHFDAMLMIDEAHSIGVIGKTGAGIREYFHIDPYRVDIWMGTLSKSFASCGGYITGRKELIEYLKYTCPSFVFSAGISPANTAAALSAIHQLKANPKYVKKLAEMSDFTRECARSYGFDIGLSHDSPIIPIIIGSSKKCIELSRALLKKKMSIKPIIYPAVAEDAARLRFFITAKHTKSQISAAFKLLNELYKKHD